MSETDDALREHILPDDMLRVAEALSRCIVRRISTGRYDTRLQVDKQIWQFKVITIGDKKELLIVQPEGMTQALVGPYVWEYVWHCAAESMLSVRNNHTEARIDRMKRKKAQVVRLRATEREA